MPRKAAPDTPLEVPFVVSIDTREQHPYSFQGLIGDSHEKRRPLLVPTQVETIPSGDYSIQGWHDKVAVERKSRADFFSTLGQSRDRFERELARLHKLDFAAIVVEDQWDQIITNPPLHSHLDPKTAYRSVIAWQQRFFRVHWWFCPGRDFAERTTFRILQRYWRDNVPS